MRQYPAKRSTSSGNIDPINLQISTGATLELSGTVASGDNITLSATARWSSQATQTLLMVESGLDGFTGTIVGMTVGIGVIDLTGISYSNVTSATLNGDNISVTVNGGASFNLTLSSNGNYACDLVFTQNDGANGTDLLYRPGFNTGTTNNTTVSISGDIPAMVDSSLRLRADNFGRRPERASFRRASRRSGDHTILAI